MGTNYVDANSKQQQKSRYRSKLRDCDSLCYMCYYNPFFSLYFPLKNQMMKKYTKKLIDRIRFLCFAFISNNNKIVGKSNRKKNTFK